MQKQETEIDNLRGQKEEVLAREKENICVLDRQEKTFLNEINEECKKSSEVLGVTARLTTIPTNRWENHDNFLMANKLLRFDVLFL